MLNLVQRAASQSEFRTAVQFNDGGQRWIEEEHDFNNPLIKLFYKKGRAEVVSYSSDNRKIVSVT